MEQFAATLDWALRMVVVLVSPAAVGMLFFAGPITAMIMGYRAFDSEDVLRTSYALMAYSWGLLAFSFVKVLVPGYYARQNTRRPVRIAMIALAVSTGLNVFVVVPAAHFGLPQPHVLIATATCIGALVNTVLLWRGLTAEGVLRLSAGWRNLVLRVLAANVLMGALLWWMAGETLRWMQMPTLERLWRGGGGIVLAATAYFALLFLLGMRQHHLRSART
jgi:putative peptidoglycan lipid II flippase